VANEEEIKGLKAQMKWCIESIKTIAEKAGVVLKDEPPDEKPPN